MNSLPRFTRLQPRFFHSIVYRFLTVKYYNRFTEIKLESSSSFISTNRTSRGPRGNRMQQLAALWLADCTSGLMHLLTRKLIFHRGYILSHFSLPLSNLPIRSFSLSRVQLSRFVFHRLLDSPLLFSSESFTFLSASLTVNPSHAIYATYENLSLFTVHFFVCPFKSIDNFNRNFTFNFLRQHKLKT